MSRALDEHGDAVFAVVATGGTTNFGIVDDIAGVGAAAKAHGAWFHVDGAYGLAAMLVESMRPAFAGVELADSVIVDPHKWLFAPFDSCALLYREPARARAAHLAPLARVLVAVRAERLRQVERALAATAEPDDQLVAGSDIIHVTVEGIASHAGRPQEGVDALKGEFERDTTDIPGVVDRAATRR